MDNHRRRSIYPYNLSTSTRNTNNRTESYRFSQNQSRQGRNLQRNPHLIRRQNAFQNRLTGIARPDNFSSTFTITERFFNFENNNRNNTYDQFRPLNVHIRTVRSTDNDKEMEEAIERRIKKFDSFILKEASEENHCSICMDEEAKEVTMIRLTCSHEICKTCVKSWFKNKLDCPICREKYSLQEY